MTGNASGAGSGADPARTGSGSGTGSADGGTGTGTGSADGGTGTGPRDHAAASRVDARSGAKRTSHLERRTVCSSGVAFLDTLDRLEVEDGSMPPHVEEILPRAAIASARALFSSEVSEAMLDDNTLSQMFATRR